MKTIIKKIQPDFVLRLLRLFKSYTIRKTRQIVERLGFNISRTSDYYSPLATESKIKKNVSRWNKASSMAGIAYDVENYKALLKELVSKYWVEFNALPNYEENKSIGFGPGYTELDALVLYMMIRNIKPKRYFEVGSGLSTYYCSLAAKENAKNGESLKIKCIEPYPFERLYSIQNIEVIQDEVQNAERNLFLELETNDILFIDSSHVVKIDGDVPFLYLEILPVLKKGVIVHIHDIPFPFNTPYPAEQWVLGKTKTSPNWPMYWNEAMLLQAFLMFNNSYEIVMSAPLIRYYDEEFLKNNIPLYKSIEQEPNTFSSIWLRRVN